MIRNNFFIVIPLWLIIKLWLAEVIGLEPIAQGHEPCVFPLHQPAIAVILGIEPSYSVKRSSLNSFRQHPHTMTTVNLMHLTNKTNQLHNDRELNPN